MNDLTWLLLGAGVFLVLNVLSAGANVSSLNFSIDSVNVGSSGLNATLLVGVNIQNPTSSSYTISSITANFYLNGTLTGNVSSFSPITIGPNSQSSSPYVLTVVLQPGAVISDIMSVLNGGANATARLAGTANAGISIPFDISYTLI
jgi:LEA14-like dessication related protein